MPGKNSSAGSVTADSSLLVSGKREEQTAELFVLLSDFGTTFARRGVKFDRCVKTLSVEVNNSADKVMNI